MMKKPYTFLLGFLLLNQLTYAESNVGEGQQKRVVEKHVKKSAISQNEAFFAANVSIKNLKKFKQYAKQAGASMQPYGGKLLFKGKRIKQLAGESKHNLLAIVSFPSQKHLHDWFHSDSYQKLIPLRNDSADIQLASFDPSVKIHDFVKKIPVDAIEESLIIPRKNVNVLGSNISYIEQGKGNPVLFIHGNPTSAYLWRNVMPHVAKSSRAIAIDLIGMGDSDKPDIGYTFEDHYKYFSAFIDKLELKEVTLVGHDWGAALAWEYARRNPKKVVRIAFMEGVLPPTFPVPSFESMEPEMGAMFKAFKDPVLGNKLVVKDNIFVEKVLPGFVDRTLGEEALAVYRQPFLTEKSRKPILAWPRQVPIAGKPKTMVTTMNRIEAFMKKTDLPVLILYVTPGAVTPEPAVKWYVKNIKEVETSYIGKGLHFIQEDHPHKIGSEIADWIRRKSKSGNQK